MIGDSELRSRRHVLKRLAKSWVLPRMFADIDRFLTVGDANEAYYRHYGVKDDRMVRCCFPIDTTLYDRALAARTEARARIRSQHGVPPDHVVLLMVGKLVPRKRQTDLVNLSNQMQRSHSGVTVVLSGSGPDEAKLRSLTVRTGAGGVIFAGFVPETTLPDYYCAADVYVHCSEQEPHSLAISEAIYCGLPVVLSSSCGSHGPSDDVRIGLNGYVYQTGAIADLKARLTPLIGSPDRRAGMGKASSEIARVNQRLAHGTGILQALDSIGL
jgi:glycosyltransferase involved in cell wall biosynthesis